jgi:hypothetical protein
MSKVWNEGAISCAVHRHYRDKTGDLRENSKGSGVFERMETLSATLTKGGFQPQQIRRRFFP